MGKNYKNYEILLGDLKRGMVEGLEESYLEFKLQNISLSQETLKSILHAIEKPYNVKLKNTLAFFPQTTDSLKISDIIKILISFIELKLNKPQNLLVPSLILSSKVHIVEFSEISFNEFMHRINLCASWISENLEKTEPIQLIREVLAKCKIQPTEEELKAFGKELRKLFSCDYCFGFPDFRALTFAWYGACHSQENIRLKLMKTIDRFEEIGELSVQESEKILANDLVANLKAKLEEIPNCQTTEEIFEKRCAEGIAQIFKFYSKPQFLKEKSPTSRSIKASTEALNLGNFTQFCKDFQITQGKNSKITIRFARQVFSQTAESSRSMLETHFLQALEKIAEKFFDKSFDKENHTKWSELSVRGKKLKLYEYLSFHRPEIYSVKLKGLIPNFGLEELERIPQLDLGKNKQSEKGKLEKRQVKEWDKKREALLPGKAESKGYSARFQKMKVRGISNAGTKGRSRFLSDEDRRLNGRFSKKI